MDSGLKVPLESCEIKRIPFQQLQTSLKTWQWLDLKSNNTAVPFGCIVWWGFSVGVGGLLRGPPVSFNKCNALPIMNLSQSLLPAGTIASFFSTTQVWMNNASLFIVGNNPKQVWANVK